MRYSATNNKQLFNLSILIKHKKLPAKTQKAKQKKGKRKKYCSKNLTNGILRVNIIIHKKRGIIMKKIILLLCTFFTMSGYKNLFNLPFNSLSEIKSVTVRNRTEKPFYIAYTNTRNTRQIFVLSPNEEVSLDTQIKGSNSLTITNPQEEVSYQLSEHENHHSLYANYCHHLATYNLNKCFSLKRAVIELNPSDSFTKPFDIWINYN